MPKYEGTEETGGKRPDRPPDFRLEAPDEKPNREKAAMRYDAWRPTEKDEQHDAGSGIRSKVMRFTNADRAAILNDADSHFGVKIGDVVVYHAAVWTVAAIKEREIDERIMNEQPNFHEEYVKPGGVQLVRVDGNSRQHLEEVYEGTEKVELADKDLLRKTEGLRGEILEAEHIDEVIAAHYVEGATGVPLTGGPIEAAAKKITLEGREMSNKGEKNLGFFKGLFRSGGVMDKAKGLFKRLTKGQEGE